MLSIDKFLEYLRSELNRSQRTVENYREDLNLFEQYARNLSESDRKSTRLNSSHSGESRMPSSA